MITVHCPTKIRAIWGLLLSIDAIHVMETVSQILDLLDFGLEGLKILLETIYTVPEIWVSTEKKTYSSVLESSCCIALPKLEAITVGDSPRDEV